MVEAEPRAGRSAEVPEALLTLVVEALDPQTVILFGSHARGEAGPDSDWDLFVIVDDDAPRERVSLDVAYRAILPFPEAADVVPCRRMRFEARRGVIGSLAWTAAEEGVVVYERP